jgi:tetratricopeptide (TPR) repeat protein
MAEKIKYTRKDLKGPDEFISAFSRAVAWTQENRTKVLATAGGVLLLVLAVLGGRAYFRWEENRASRDLWPYVNQARDSLESPSAADREKLVQLERFLGEQVAKHPGTIAAVYARYYLGGIAFVRGDYDRSASQYREAIRESKIEGVMPYLLRKGLAQALDAKGDYAAASEAYREAAAASEGELRVQAEIGQARTLALAGRKPEAATLYRQILGETADPRVKELIEIKLAQAE